MEDKERVSLAAQMQRDLNKSKDGVVLIVSCNKGKREEFNGVLEDVHDYETVRVGGRVFPFLNLNSAIIGVITFDGKVLYYNPYIDATYGIFDEEKNLNNLLNISKLMFGDEHSEMMEQRYNSSEFYRR